MNGRFLQLCIISASRKVGGSLGNLIVMPRALLRAQLIVFSVAMSAMAFSSVQAQELSVDEIKEMLEEQKMALEEAIANREATAAKAEEVKAELAESEKHQLSVEEELSALCEEQEELKAGSFDECMNN